MRRRFQRRVARDRCDAEQVGVPAATTIAIASSCPGSQSRMTGGLRGIAAMTRRACTDFHRCVSSNGGGCLHLVVAAAAACSIILRHLLRRGPLPSVTDHSARGPRAPNPQACRVWWRRIPSARRGRVCRNAPELSPRRLVRRLSSLQLASPRTGRCVLRLVEVANAIDASWPSELTAERGVVIDQRIVPLSAQSHAGSRRASHCWRD